MGGTLRTLLQCVSTPLKKACLSKEEKIVHNISLFSAEHSLHKNAMEVLAPPVADYFKCGSPLVPYSKAIEWCKGSTEK